MTLPLQCSHVTSQRANAQLASVVIGAKECSGMLEHSREARDLSPTLEASDSNVGYIRLWAIQLQ